MGDHDDDDDGVAEKQISFNWMLQKNGAAATVAAECV
jgi:hypothetical protein